MNVFFSWSGSVSHRVAHELADWLPYVVQAIKPFISSEHIDKGERWNEELMAYLNGTSYGVICITRHNINATWMNFEAGALSKALHRPDVAHSLSRSNVVPFLFGVDSTEISGPLEQFQATAYRQDETANKEEVFKLVSSMNSQLDAQQQVPQERLKRQFDKWWPELKDRFDKINPMEESGNIAGLPWLFSLQDMRNIQAYHTQCRLLWIIAPELLKVIAGKTDDIINNIKRGIHYVYIFPDQDADNDTGEGELRRIIERTNAASLVIRKTPFTQFNSLAVSNYIIVNPDCEERAFPLRMFIQLPIQHADQYWIEVEHTAAIKFVERFRDVANGVMPSVPPAPAASPHPAENNASFQRL